MFDRTWLILILLFLLLLLAYIGSGVYFEFSLQLFVDSHCRNVLEILREVQKLHARSTFLLDVEI